MQNLICHWRVTALCLACALLSAIFCLPAAAAPTVFFAAVDYEILSLSAAHMPINSGGNVYAPVAVFTAGATGLFSSNDGREVWLFRSGNKKLAFDLETGVAHDGDVQYSYRAVRQSGRSYLPVEHVCTHFDMTYDVMDTDYGPLLRLRVKSSAATDQNFLYAAHQGKLEELYQAYIGTPAPPAATASPSPSPPPEDPIVYLTFDDGPNVLSDRILDILDEYGVKATFFLLGSNLKNNEQAVRRMIGSGHAVGLHSWTHDAKKFYGSPESMLDELKRNNDKLEQITMYRSRLVRTPFGGVPHMTPILCQAMTDGGYRFWDWNIDGDPGNRPTAADVSAGVIGDLENLRDDDPPVILLHEREKTVAALSAILDYMTRKNYDFRICTESERPINFRKWIK